MIYVTAGNDMVGCDMKIKRALQHRTSALHIIQHKTVIFQFNSNVYLMSASVYYYYN